MCVRVFGFVYIALSILEGKRKGDICSQKNKEITLKFRKYNDNGENKNEIHLEKCIASFTRITEFMVPRKPRII